MWPVGNGLMKLKQITGLTRLLDPRFPTNLGILAMATAVGTVGFIGQLVSGNCFLEAAGWSLTLGFLTISTLREVKDENCCNRRGRLYWFPLGGKIGS
jgi:hypothetical protein